MCSSDLGVETATPITATASAVALTALNNASGLAKGTAFTSDATFVKHYLVVGSVVAAGTNASGTAGMTINHTRGGVARTNNIISNSSSVATVGLGATGIGVIDCDVNTAVTVTVTLGGTQTAGTNYSCKLIDLDILSATI